MKSLKIDNYLEAFPDSVFPAFESLGDAARVAVSTAIRKNFAIANNADDLAMVMSLDALGEPCSGVYAINPSFRLSRLLLDLNIPLPQFLYVNWYRYDDIDRFRLIDLDELFEHIWYPGAEDIAVFDDSLAWVISVSHDGGVKLCRALHPGTQNALRQQHH